MKRVTKGYSGDDIPLFPSMIIAPETSPSRITSSPSLSPQHTPVNAPSTSPPPITETTPTAEEPTLMPHESPLQSVHSLRRDEGSVSLNELMDLVTQLTNKVGSLENELMHTKKVYGSAITKLVKRVKQLEKQVKTGTARRGTNIVLLEDKAVEEDSSKQGRSLIEELDMDADFSLVPPYDAEIQEKINDDTEVLLEEEETTKLIEEPTELVEDQGSGEKREQEVTTADTELNTTSVPFSTASATPEVSTAAESLVYIRRSAKKKKDRGKAIMIEDESVQKKSKKQVQEERLGYEEAIRLQEQIDKEERKRIARDVEIAKQLQEEYDKVGKKEAITKVDIAHVIDWNDPSVIRYHALKNRPRYVAEVTKNMMVYLKNQRGYKMKDFKGMSYDDIRPIFKKVWDQIHSFVPMDSEEEVKRLKRAGQDIEAKPIKRQRTEDVSETVQEQTDEDPKIDELSQEKVGNHTKVYQVFEDMLKNFDRDDLIKLWSLVQERYNSSGLTEDKEIEFWLLEDKVLLNLDWAKNQKTKSTLKKTVAFADEGSSNFDTDKIMARMDAMTQKMDAQYKELQSKAKKTKPDLDEDNIPMSREEEAKFMQTFGKTHFYNDYRDQDSNRDNWRSNKRSSYNRDNYRSNTDDKSYDLQKQFNNFKKSQQSTNAFVKETIMDLKTQLETIAKNHQAFIQNLETKFDRLADKQSGRPSGSLPCNTQPNPKGHNSKAYQPPQSRNEHVNVAFTRSDEGSKILHSIKGTLLEEEIFVEFDEFMAMTADENSDFESNTEEPPFEKITINTDFKIKTSLKEPPTDLELKPLPNNMEYVFLEEPSFLPVITSSQLSKEKKSNLYPSLKSTRKLLLGKKGHSWYCKCRMPFNPGVFMLECEACKERVLKRIRYEDCLLWASTNIEKPWEWSKNRHENTVYCEDKTLADVQNTFATYGCKKHLWSRGEIALSEALDNEMIIVNEYGINDILDDYLEDTNKRYNLTQHRFRIFLGTAKGLTTFTRVLGILLIASSVMLVMLSDKERNMRMYNLIGFNIDAKLETREVLSRSSLLADLMDEDTLDDSLYKDDGSLEVVRSFQMQVSPIYVLSNGNIDGSGDLDID
ncbi:hypothetical protein Tco_1164616 [Tanacetum coccineum]